jgi:hypothetical protein
VEGTSFVVTEEVVLQG